MKFVSLLIVLTLLWSAPVFSQDLTPADVRISLDKALPIALKAAAQEFPDLHDYILHSVTPRVLKGDRHGLHWQFEWQEKTFPHRKLLRVRVYMGDGSLYTERLEKGEHQLEQGHLSSPTTTLSCFPLFSASQNSLHNTERKADTFSIEGPTSPNG